MEFLFLLAPVDWMAIGVVVCLGALIMVTDSGGLGKHRRSMAYAMLLLACTMAYILATTNVSDSVFFGNLVEDANAAKKKRAAQSARAHSKKQPGKDPTGPGDGGEGEEMSLVLAGVETPGGGGPLGPAAKEGGNRAGGANKKGGSMSAEAPEGGSGEPDDITEEEGPADISDNLKTRQDCDRCPVMALIPRGSLVLGADEQEPGYRPHEGPLRRVKFDQPFWIGRFEVTREQFAEFVRRTDHRKQRGCVVQHQMRRDYGLLLTGLAQEDNHPAVCVSWLDAKAYVEWLSRFTGKPYRLPSESEWEYAARGGRRTIYPNGDEIEREDGNFDLAIQNTMPVGHYRQNPFGLFDLSGNVWELVEDCWSADRTATRPDGSAFIVPGCEHRVMKGGAWYSPPIYLRAASRWSNPAAAPGNGVGFRVAREVVRRKKPEAVAAQPIPAEPPTPALAAPAPVPLPIQSTQRPTKAPTSIKATRPSPPQPMRPPVGRRAVRFQ